MQVDMSLWFLQSNIESFILLKCSYTVNSFFFLHAVMFISFSKSISCQGIKILLISAARLVLGRSKYDHTTPMLRELHWLPIKARIEYKLALTCFKSKSGNYPSYISDLLVPYTPTRSLRSSSSNNFSIPRIHLKGFGERAFTFSGPSVWNALPQELKSCSTLGHFKKQLKTHLFRKYLN